MNEPSDKRVSLKNNAREGFREMYVNIESNESNVKRKHLSSYVHFIPPNIPCLFRFSKLQDPGKNINSGKNYDVTWKFYKVRAWSRKGGCINFNRIRSDRILKEIDKSVQHRAHNIFRQKNECGWYTHTHTHVIHISRNVVGCRYEETRLSNTEFLAEPHWSGKRFWEKRRAVSTWIK